jgi:quercetin dioxygenase-like cupin family protein
MNLGVIGEEALAKARAAGNGRHSELLVGGSGHRLRQVLMALVAGEALQDHENPGEATLQVLVGQVRLHAGEESLPLTAGDLAVVPQQRHGVTATTDAVILLTVAKHQ